MKREKVRQIFGAWDRALAAAEHTAVVKSKARRCGSYWKE